jgi:hypothetical protein
MPVLHAFRQSLLCGDANRKRPRWAIVGRPGVSRFTLEE